MKLFQCGRCGDNETVGEECAGCGKEYTEDDFVEYDDDEIEMFNPYDDN